MAHLLMPLSTSYMGSHELQHEDITASRLPQQMGKVCDVLTVWPKVIFAWHGSYVINLMCAVRCRYTVRKDVGPSALKSVG
jgi:hypothetical protein